MRGDPAGVEYLNKALRHELTAVNITSASR